ncbi:V-type ATPase subunit [Candidatus Woesearchaeota archaeon]|nr:V-type ATPase subunit [Candidatus Woesearchaeota archaeon]
MLQRYSSPGIESGGRYPYAYARVCVMRAALLGRQDYDRLLRMGLSEVIGFLESSQYKAEIDALAVRFSGVSLMEQALNLNLANTYQKLRRFSGPSLQRVLDVYLKRRDRDNFKAVLRGIYTSSSEDDVMNVLVPYSVSAERLRSVFRRQSVEEALRDSGLPAAQVKVAVDRFRETGSLAEVENVIDSEYRRAIVAGMQGMGSSLFREFLAEEMLIAALIKVLRYRREGMDKRDMQKAVADAEPMVRRLSELGLAEILSALENSRFGEHVRQGVKEFREKETLIYVETGLYKYLLRKALSLHRRKPLLADSIVGYVFAKEIEIRNLRLIMKARQLGMAEGFIEEQLVV